MIIDFEDAPIIPGSLEGKTDKVGDDAYLQSTCAMAPGIQCKAYDIAVDDIIYLYLYLYYSN